jgi:5-methylthioribose kinase
MATILDTDNVFEYLIKLNYCNVADRDTSRVTEIFAKNFNLLISFADGKNLLIKQEPHDCDGQAIGEFQAAWRMQELVKSFPDFGETIRNFLPDLLHFDPESSILVVKYLTDYCDLNDYYVQGNKFPIKIARSIGQLLANIHSQTFQRTEYQCFLNNSAAELLNIDETTPNFKREILAVSDPAINIIRRIDRITPDKFQEMPHECFQFFKLYQRFPSLSQAIVDLGNSIMPSCLVHNDLKINNILLDLNWELPGSQVVRLIDWERAGWGDPAFDLGSILGSYLEIWLDGLVISNALSIQESLQLATTPLELLQPSLLSLVQSYLDGFPAMIDARPDYLDRAIQFAGLALIHRVEITIQGNRMFGNHGIIMLEVAKQLLCNPTAVMDTLFGSNFTQLINK